MKQLRSIIHDWPDSEYEIIFIGHNRNMGTGFSRYSAPNHNAAALAWIKNTANHVTGDRILVIGPKVAYNGDVQSVWAVFFTLHERVGKIYPIGQNICPSGWDYFYLINDNDCEPICADEDINRIVNKHHRIYSRNLEDNELDYGIWK